MTNARDKANIPVLNFSSKGIDDNATSTAVTILADGKVGIGVTNPSVTMELSGNGGAIRLPTGGELQFGDANNLILGNSGSDYLMFKTNGSERMRIFSGGNVSIGTTSDPTKLAVSKGSSGVSPHNLGDELFIENNGDTGFTIGSSTSGTGNIFFGDSGDPNRGRIRYHHSTDKMEFGTAGANEKLIIDSSGNVGIGTSSPSSKLEATGTILASVDGTGLKSVGANAQIHADASSGYGALITDGASSQSSYIFFQTAGTDKARLTADSSGNFLFGAGGATERMRITSGGGLLLGTTDPQGLVTNGRQITAGFFVTRKKVHTFSATNTYETVETFSSNNGVFLLSARGSGGGNPTNDDFIGFVIVNGGNAIITSLKTCSNVQVQMSGLNLQIRQQYFSTANISYSLLRLNS